MDIQRWNHKGEPDDYGGFVSFASHIAEVERLKVLLRGWRIQSRFYVGHKFCETISNEDHDYRCDLCKRTEKELSE